MRIVDFRSDTLTKPTNAMRAAMAAAEVGDDVFGEDPTIQRLEARAAELAGKEAALFVPSGTMANLIACKVHTRPGDEVIVERTSHLYRYEAGGYAMYAGVSVALVDGTRGLLGPEQVHAAIRLHDVHQPRTRLLWLEDTHNAGGGSCYPLDHLAAVVAAGRAHGLAVHLDGARVWNACVAQGVTLATIADQVDSLNFCFSKGLGCPVGSILVGSRALVTDARHIRRCSAAGCAKPGSSRPRPSTLSSITSNGWPTTTPTPPCSPTASMASRASASAVRSRPTSSSSTRKAAASAPWTWSGH